MKKLFALLLVFMLACVASVVGMAEDTYPSQIVEDGGTVFYNASGSTTSGPLSGNNDAVVEMSKTIAPYTERVNGKDVPVENEFVVTLNVKTQEKILEISSDTPDSAILLVMDVSNSMDDCVICGKEESHSDHQGESQVHYYCSGNSGNEYERRSNYNSLCRHCNRYQSQHNEVRTVSGAKCAYVSRLDRTQTAAKDFLSEFANETGAQGDDKRMVGIVAYGSHAVNVLGYGNNDSTNWENIRTEEGMTAVMDAIDGLSVANSSYSSSLQGGGTSIESGLTLARNILNTGAATGGEINGINYVYTILLTDGQPTYPVSTTGNNGINSNSVEYISGNTGANSGSSTQEADYNDAATLAATIRGLNNNGLSKLYSICFGKVDGDPVWELKVIGNQTVGDWLKGFSTAAYNAEAAQNANLFDAFNSVMSQIQLASKAWKVEDWMGDHMIMGEAVPVSNGSNGSVHNAINLSPNAADYADGKAPAFVWDILGSEPDATSTYDEELKEGTLSYTYKYRVTLDNLALSYSTTNGSENSPQNPAQNANAKATLRYAAMVNNEWPTTEDGYKTGTFPIPQVKGLVGDLTFEKVDDQGASIGAGWTFRLRIDHDTASGYAETHWEYVDAVADSNGIVTFTGIPSGHDYRLLEAERTATGANYADAGDKQLSLDWSAFSGLTDSADEDDLPELVNERLEKPASLILEKEFTADNEVMPYGIQLLISGTGSNSSFTARRYLYASDDQNNDGVWSWELAGLKPGTYTVAEMNAIDHNGNLLREDHNLQFNVYKDGAAQYAAMQTFDAASGNYPQIEVTLGDDARVAVRFLNKMTRKVGTLSIEKAFEALPSALVGNHLAITMTATEVADENGTALTGAKTYTLPFTYANGKYTTTATLPIGFYKIEETVIPQFDGYTFLHYAFKDGETFLGATPIIEIEETHTANAPLRFILNNHYEQDRGNIHVFKVFGGDLAQGTMTDEEYKEFLEKEVVDDQGNPIAITINVKQGNETVGTMYMSADTDWAAELNDLPIGEYTLEEVTTNLDVHEHILKNVNWSVVDNKVTVSKNEISRATVTNTYDEATSELAVAKSFVYGQEMTAATFADKTIYVYVMQDDGDPDTYDLKDTLELNAGNQWTDSAVLPVGTYQLYEAVSTTNPNTAYVPGYTLATEWTIGDQTRQGSSVVVTLADHDQAQVPKVEIGLKNTYTANDGTLTLAKQNSGDLTKMPARITFEIVNVNDASDKKTVELESENDWNESISLRPGTYTVTEVVAADADPAMISWSGDVTGTTENSATVTITIGVNTVIDVVCKNDYYYQHELTFQKIDIATQNPIAGVEFTLRHTANCCGFAIADQTATSASDGTVTFNKVLGPHTYVLTETALEDYAEIAPLTVVATETGVSISGVTDGIINNVPVNWPTTTLSFTKISSFTNAPLMGAEFTLTHNASVCTGNYHGDTESGSMTATSGDNGLVSFSGVETGHSYTLTETKTPTGYNTIDAMTVVVDNNGDITVTDAAGKTVDLNGKTLVNDLTVWPTVNLGFAKYSSYTQAPLANVQFSLSHSADCTGCMNAITEPITAKSGVNGSVWLANIPVGHTYILSETVVPTGYDQVDDMIVVVAKDKTISVKKENGETIALEGSILYNHLTEWPTASLSFTKHSSYTQAPLAGVEFTLAHNDDCMNCPGLPPSISTPMTFTTTDTGVVTFAGIPAGHTYTLSETKVPDSYTAVEPMTVTVTTGTSLTDPSVTVTNAAGEPVALEGSILYNHLTEWPTKSLTFTKLSSYDNSVIEGAQFDLVHDDCCETEIDLTPVTSDKYGKVTIEKIPLNHTYTLKEIKTPDGYKTMKDMLVRVTVDGVILVGDKEEKIPTTGLIIYNDLTIIPTSYTFKATKTMDGETPKEQYTFILSYNGEEIARTQNDGSEITFAPLLFTEEGKEIFTITEEIGDNAKVLYDKSVYTVTVTAKKGTGDVLEFVTDIDKDGNTHNGAIEFHNETMKELPETGDNSKLGLWLAMLAMASVGFVVLAKRKAVRG